MEALAKVNWLDTDLGCDCAQTILHALAHMGDSPCAPLLGLLASNLPKIPETHRYEQFQAILAYTVRLTAQEQAGMLDTLRDALRHLPVQYQPAARTAIDSACMPAQSEMKPSALATNLQDVPRMNGRTFMQSITDAEKRSPVNRASALLQLAASLDLLSQEQRQNCFHTLLDATRGQVLERTAVEISQLPQPARAAAWQALHELADNLPDQAQAEVLMCFCGAVSSLPDRPQTRQFRGGASVHPQSQARNPSALPARDSKPALYSRIETAVADLLPVSTHHGALLERC